VWVLAILVFFSVPHSKLVGYILPVVPPLALLSALGWERVMAHRAFAGKVFAGLCVVNIGMALALMLKVGDVTRDSRTQDVAQALACAANPGDTVFASGAYPYDLPFYAQTSQQIVVLEDWPMLRRQAGDGWQRELFEGADFDAKAALALQPTQVLSQAGLQPGYWFTEYKNNHLVKDMPGWKLFYQGAGWSLYQSGQTAGTPSALESPKTAQHKGLPGCKH